MPTKYNEDKYSCNTYNENNYVEIVNIIDEFEDNENFLDREENDRFIVIVVDASEDIEDD